MKPKPKLKNAGAISITILVMCALFTACKKEPLPSDTLVYQKDTTNYIDTTDLILFYISGGGFNNRKIIIPSGNATKYNCGQTHIRLSGAYPAPNYLQFYFPDTTTGTYTASAGHYLDCGFLGISLKIEGRYLLLNTDSQNVVVNVSHYGNLFDRVRGSFSGTVKTYFGDTTYTITGGRFSVFRER